jgi:hypothetical protein
MRELWGRLSTVNKVGLFGALIGFLIGMGAVIIADPVTGIFIVAACVALTVFCFWFFFHADARRFKLQKSGVPATAEIIEVRSTGVTLNEVYPQVELLLEVHREGIEPYRVKTKFLIDQVDIPRYQAGNSISVMVDPGDKDKVAPA